MRELMHDRGIEMGSGYNDCGNMIFYAKEQDVHAGGSGCGCSAVVLCGYIFEKMRKGEINSALFVGTGALMNPTMLLQGESIPGIAHAVAIRNTLQV